jgi:hypothetical protein
MLQSFVVCLIRFLDQDNFGLLQSCGSLIPLPHQPIQLFRLSWNPDILDRIPKHLSQFPLLQY